jgi:hypothetical protein
LAGDLPVQRVLLLVDVALLAARETGPVVCLVAGIVGEGAILGGDYARVLSRVARRKCGSSVTEFG